MAIERRDAIQPAFDALLGVVDEVFDVTLADVRQAKEIVLGASRLSARDAVHLAEAAVRREAIEETGCDILNLEFIGKTYPSPGSSDPPPVSTTRAPALPMSIFCRAK